jgi:hypothetical protein
MVCTCGARLPVNNRFSICDGCLQADDDDGIEFDRDFDRDDHDSYLDESDGDFEDDDVGERAGGEDQFLDSYMEDRMSGGGDF